MAKSKIEQCVERGKNHWHGAVGEDGTGSIFQWASAGTVFAEPCGAKPLLHCVRHWCQDNRKDVHPLAAQRSAVQVVTGQIAAIVVDCLFVRQNPDVDAFLKDAPHFALAAYPYFLLSPGDTLVLPLGSTAIYLGVCIMDGKVVVAKLSPKVKVAPEEYSSFIVHPSFDHEVDKLHAPETQLTALHAYMHALNWIPASYRKCPRIAKWREVMEEAQNPTGGDPSRADAPAEAQP